jgi:hypothetical protein
MTTLSDGTTTLTPALVDGYDAAQDTRTIVHELIGGGVEYTLRAAGTRAGTLTLVFPVELDAETARAALAQPAVWTLTDPDRSTVGMRFVVAGGQLGVRLDETTRDVWLVTVPFREVPL